MLYLGHNWDLSPNLIIPDEELSTDRLGWKVGDYWRVAENAKGNKILVKIDPLVKFLEDGKNGTN